MAESTVAMPETEETQAVMQPEIQAVEATRPREHYMTPPVDIYETPESLVVISDLPGMTIHIKRDTQLSIAYSEELIFSMSVTLQSTDRHHGIVG
jgi:HSP20 family molecular chaperone IbpA